MVSSPLPPGTPTQPKAFSPKITTAFLQNGQRTINLFSRKRQIENADRSGSPQPRRRAAVPKHRSPPPPSEPSPAWLEADHWSPAKTFDDSVFKDLVKEKRYQDQEFGRLSPVHGEKKKESRKQALPAAREEHTKAISPKPAAPAVKPRFLSLLSVAVVGSGLDSEAEKQKLCYNCGKKGHWFVDCLVGCGRCAGDGHRTMDCSIVSSRHGFTRLKEITGELKRKLR